MDEGNSQRNSKDKSKIQIKSKRKSKGIVNFWCRREVFPLSLARNSATSDYLVLSLDIHQRAVRHRGPVMTVSFSPDGDTLVSGSADGRVKLSNWETEQVNVSFLSGHYDRLLHAQIMPGNQKIVTCSHQELRLATIHEGGVHTKSLKTSNASFRMITMSPTHPNDVYICSDDGLVTHVDVRTEKTDVLFSCGYSLWGGGGHRRLPLSTIGIDIDPTFLAVGGPNRLARLFDIRNLSKSHGFHQPVACFCPSNLIGKEGQISGLTFSQQGELLVSYRRDSIYLFSSKKGLDTVSYKGHENTEFGRNVAFTEPNSDYIISGSDCGRVFVWKKTDGKLIRVLGGSHTLTVGSHPFLPVVATCGAGRHPAVWSPKGIRPTLPDDIPEAPFYDGNDDLPYHYPQEHVKILDNSNDGNNDDDSENEEEDFDA